MFVHVIPVHVMEMAVVKIIHVAVMTDPGVPAVGAMLVGMIGMMLLGAGFHHCVLSSLRNQLGPHCFSVGSSIGALPTTKRPEHR